MCAASAHVAGSPWSFSADMVALTLSLITGVRGARANQPRKATKKDSHDMWNEV